MKKLIKKKYNYGDNWNLKLLMESVDEILTEMETVELEMKGRKTTAPKDETYAFAVLAGCCVFCGRDHPSEYCKALRSLRERKSFLRRHRLCFVCLRQGHMVRECRSQGCALCGPALRHHVAICYKTQREGPRGEDRYGATDEVYYGRQAGGQDRRLGGNTGRAAPANGKRGPPSGGAGSRRERGKSREGTPPREAREVRERHEKKERQEKKHQEPRKEKRATKEAKDGKLAKKSKQVHVHVVTKDPDMDDDEGDEDVALHLVGLYQTRFDSDRGESEGQVILMTGRARASNGTDGVEIDIFFDQGAQRSFISQDLFKKLQLRSLKTSVLRLTTFGSHGSRAQKTTKTEVLLYNTQGEARVVYLYTAPTLVQPFSSAAFDDTDKNFIHDRRLQMSDPDLDPHVLEPVVVIGADQMWDLVGDLTLVERLPSGLLLLPTHFGFMPTGRRVPGLNFVGNVFIENANEKETDIDLMFRLDLLGIKDDPSSTLDDPDTFYREFVKHIELDNGRYVMGFPWKPDCGDPSTNYNLAFRRLCNLVKKYQQREDVWKKYCKIIEEQLTSGIIEAVDMSEVNSNCKAVYYLPHQAVVTPQKTTTKVRVVCDASSHERGKPSLNDCVDQGPSMLPDLGGMLLRFRMENIQLLSDVEKAFHQVGLRREDRDAVRFLWLRDPSRPIDKTNLLHLRFARVPFGVNASPFMLAAGIRHHLEEKGDEVSLAIWQNTYVDNVYQSAKDTQEALALYSQSKQTFSEIGMNLREFTTNDAIVREGIPETDRAKDRHQKALGLPWDTLTDLIRPKCDPPTTEVVTKRLALQTCASVFDPLGLLLPLVLPLRTFVQHLWQKNLEWDDPLPDELQVEWQKKIKAVSGPTPSLPRRVASYNDTLDLILFVDASQQAYAAAAYMRREDCQGQHTNQLMAKGRLAPMKELSLPRLELMALLIGSRLAVFIKKELNRANFRHYYLFSDSTATLHWVTTRRELKTFVKNRVMEIRRNCQLLGNEQTTLHYVDTKDNVADYATRGLTRAELFGHVWWFGPSWLRNDPSTWPIKDFDQATPVTTPVSFPLLAR